MSTVLPNDHVLTEQLTLPVLQELRLQAGETYTITFAQWLQRRFPEQVPAAQPEALAQEFALWCRREGKTNVEYLG
jgi:hypothetical protein